MPAPPNGRENERVMAALFWDVDGTLLTTGRAGMFAFEEAVTAVTGVEADLSTLFTSGLTDDGVAALVLEAAGCDPSPEARNRVLREYERRLPDSLPRREGRVLPGVAEALADLQGRRDVRSLLLTGNTPAGARAKLAYYGLDRFFPDGGGGFCIDSGSRTDIARRALSLAGDAERVYVIGDTPADIDCGKAVGARTIAVASGWHTLDDLAAHEPWVLLERILEPEQFRKLLELGEDG
jgi:phosphoglycolate phosphatase-like HAD superfamily hydrolase